MTEIGQTYGHLTVVRRAEPLRKPNGRRQAMVVVVCDCGSGERTVRADNLGRSSTSCGCTRKAPRPARRSDVVTYAGAHTRLDRWRGKASAQACVDCADGTPAAHWSYDKTGLDEHTEVIDGRTLAYSTDVEQYSPRCVAHHVEFDRTEQTHCRRGHPYSESYRKADGTRASCRTCVREQYAARVAAQSEHQPTDHGSAVPCPSPSPVSS